MAYQGFNVSATKWHELNNEYKKLKALINKFDAFKANMEFQLKMINDNYISEFKKLIKKYESILQNNIYPNRIPNTILVPSINNNIELKSSLEIESKSNSNENSNKNDKLINVFEKSKYKTLIIKWCRQHNYKYPHESSQITNQGTKNQRYKVVLTFEHENSSEINKHSIASGEGRKYKESLYHAYKELIPQLMSIQEANQFLSKCPFDRKKTLIQLARNKNIDEPKIVFKEGFDINGRRPNFTAWVSFMNKEANATAFNKMDAVQQACKDIQMALFPLAFVV